MDRIEDVFATAELLARERRPAGPRLAIVTNAGGPGVMAADALLARGGVLAELAAETARALAEALPRVGVGTNPVDVLGDAPPERFGLRGRRPCSATPASDAVLAILTPQAMTDPTAAAAATARPGGRSAQAVARRVDGWRRRSRGDAQRSRRPACPPTTTRSRPCDAFMHLVAYARNSRRCTRRREPCPSRFALDRGRVKELLATILSEAAKCCPRLRRRRCSTRTRSR